MFDLLKISLLFIFTVLISTLLGDKLVNIFKIYNEKDNKYVAPFGFALFLCIYQLCIYPIQLFHLSSIWLVIIYLIEIAIIIFICKDNIIIVLKNYYKSIFITLLFVLIMFIIQITCYDSLGIQYSADDINFYIRHIMFNSGWSTKVNSIDPYSGQNLNVQISYAFSGMFHLYSALSTLINVRAYLFLVWFGFLITSYICFQITFMFLNRYKNIYVRIIIVAIVIANCLDKLNLFYGCLPSYFRNYSFLTSLWFILLLDYCKTNNNNYLFMHLITSVAIMSCQSSQFFICVMTTICFIIYEIIYNKNTNILFFIKISLPCFIYAFFYLLYLKQYLSLLAILIFYAVVFVLYLLLRNKNDVIIRRLYISIIALVIAILNVSFIFINNSSWPINRSLDYFANIFLPQNLTIYPIILLLFIILCVAILIKKNTTKEMVFISSFTIIAILIFYNPFVAPFVSKYMTSEVYDRTAEIVMSIAFLLEMINYIAGKKKKIINICLVAVIIINSIPTLITFVSDTRNRLNKYSEYYKTISIYKIDEQSLKLGNIIDELYDKPKNVLYPYTINNISYLSNNIRTSEYTMNRHNSNDIYQIHFEDLKKCTDKEKAFAIMEHPEYYFSEYFYATESEEVFDIKGFILKSDVDVFVIKKYKEGYTFHNVINSFAFMVGESEDYEMYEVVR